MPGGRPTKYGPEILEFGEKYLAGGWSDEGDPYPSLIGLAVALGITSQTVRAWGKDEDKEEFSWLVERIKDSQHQIAWRDGLSGKNNAVLTKLLLMKHGYHEKVEQERKTTMQVVISEKDSKL